MLGLVQKEATSSDLTGQATVIDGDTIEIHGQRIRLFGIDAPESGQTCEAGGKEYHCGKAAAFALADKIARQAVKCEDRGRDRYDRMIAICYAGSQDVGAWLVEQGWALAFRRYSVAYIGQEQTARSAGGGMWRGEFVMPWDWRAGSRLPQESTASDPAALASPAGCVIKGNISSSGQRIYHIPGQEHYAATKITEAKGERWFCTEAEAQAAGWRKARQ